MAGNILLLIHGGLAEDMDAERFWVRPGVVDALRAADLTVVAPDRDTTPPSWRLAASANAAIVAALSHDPVTVVAGSNGVSVALRLALDHPKLVDRLVLAWPATAGDDRVDARVPAAGRHLLAGDTMRGVGDDELRSLTASTTIVPSLDEDPFHQRSTVDHLAELLPDATVAEPGVPEAPRPDFPPHLERFVEIVTAAAR